MNEAGAGSTMVDPHKPHLYGHDYGRSKHCAICGSAESHPIHSVTVLAGQDPRTGEWNGHVEQASMPLDPWKHRSRHMRCATCMWYAPKDPVAIESKLGRCRRHAPTMNGYPVVFATDWCGDHKLDENKA